jgi:Tol biopolymer transport system component
VTTRAAVIALVSAVLCGLAVVLPAASRDSGYGNTNLFVVNADGSGRRNLTAGAEPAQRILRALTPDGRWVAFDQLRIDGDYGFWSIELAAVRGGSPKTLIRLAAQSAYGPAWSRDGKLLAYETCCAFRGMRVVRADGSAVSSIDDAQQASWLAGPRIAFLGGGDVTTEVATVKPDGSDRTRILYARTFESFEGLTSSADGQKFAFSAAGYMKSGESDVHWGSVSYGLLGEAANDAWSPSWSPTGRRLVYVTSHGLVTEKVDGSGRRRFRATATLSPALPSWSPDGTRIAFVTGNLVVLNVRHGTLRVVARRVARQKPVWSRDGRRLFYAGGG